MHPWAHFKTITRHKALVFRHCRRAGLVWQGLVHDLSKYRPLEFWTGARYFQGDRSPNDAERQATGVSRAWLHHKGRNKHHLEYWIDYSPSGSHQMEGMKMPVKYVVEMVCDRMAASKVYRGAAYTDRDPYDYYMRSRAHYLLHPETRALLEELLTLLKDEGEEALFRHIRTQVLPRRGSGRA